MTKKLFLIDGMAIVYRAYFGFIRNPRINSKGENVSAVYGFINTLLDIMHTYEPTHIAVAFDTGILAQDVLDRLDRRVEGHGPRF